MITVRLVYLILLEVTDRVKASTLSERCDVHIRVLATTHELYWESKCPTVIYENLIDGVMRKNTPYTI